ncbi:MAG: hypothetical protein ACLSGS_07050 [Adlercreutzia sp.]
MFAKSCANLFVSLIIAAVLAMYIGVIVSMYDPELWDAMMQSTPRDVCGVRHVGAGHHPHDFMLNYLYGFC